MKNKLFILIIVLMSFNSYGFFGFFEEDKRPDPMTLKTDEERMDYLRKYLPESYERVLDYRNYLNDLNTAGIELDKANKEWKEYEQYSGKMIDVEEEKAQNVRDKLKRQEELAKKVKEMELDILKQFKVVNGKLGI